MPRPKGRKNNATLIREAEIAKCLKLAAGTAAQFAPAIVETMAQKAIEGDTAAAKLILDRAVPIRKAQDQQSADRGQIVINITSTEGLRDAVNPLEGEAVNVTAVPANGAPSQEALGSQELAEHAGEEG